MSAVSRQLRDAAGNDVYPITNANSVYMGNGFDTVGRVLNDMQDQNTVITFPTNSVEKVMASGNKAVTVFNSDGSITETTYNSDDIAIKTKTTTFDDDGSIHIVVDGEE